MKKRVVVIGGGPGGFAAATTAARLGAEVILVERDIVGGDAHLRDCVPSKAMIATGAVLRQVHDAKAMGVFADNVGIHDSSLRVRLAEIEKHLFTRAMERLRQQNITCFRGFAEITGLHEVRVTPITNPRVQHLQSPSFQEIEEEQVLFADVIVIATGASPRKPEWVPFDGQHVLCTKDAYPPEEMPSHLLVVGSGVTGVEFVHLFSSFGAQVSLVASRQQILPQKDPEVAALLEDDFLARGVIIHKGARAQAVQVASDIDGSGVSTENENRVRILCEDGREIVGSHALFALGSVPNTENLGLESLGIHLDGGYVQVNEHCQSSVGHIYAVGDVSGKLPLSSVASLQGRKVAEHALGFASPVRRNIDYEKAASAIFTVPEIADVGLGEAEAFAAGQKIRVTKVPYSANAKAMINGTQIGFVKIISDPSTGLVLGGSIVGSGAAELIALLALAISSQLTVRDIAESLFVHPTLAELLSEAAE